MQGPDPPRGVVQLHDKRVPTEDQPLDSRPRVDGCCVSYGDVGIEPFRTQLLAQSEDFWQDEDLNVRIESLNEFNTYLLYVNICRSIFETHKLMFSFLLAIKIQMGYGKIDLAEWRFLLSGGKLNDLSKKPDVDWMTPGVWIEFINLAQVRAHQHPS